jgi:hypothetical protein
VGDVTPERLRHDRVVYDEHARVAEYLTFVIHHSGSADAPMLHPPGG